MGGENVDIAVLYRRVEYRVVSEAAHATSMPNDYVTFAKIEPARQPVTLLTALLYRLQASRIFCSLQKNALFFRKPYPYLT